MCGTLMWPEAALLLLWSRDVQCYRRVWISCISRFKLCRSHLDCNTKAAGSARTVAVGYHENSLSAAIYFTLKCVANSKKGNGEILLIPATAKKKKKKKACIKESESSIFLNTNSVMSKRGALGTVLCTSWDPVLQTLIHMLMGGPGWLPKAAQELAVTHLYKSLWNWSLVQSGPDPDLTQAAGKISGFVQACQGRSPRQAGGIWPAETLLLSQELDKWQNGACTHTNNFHFFPPHHHR